MSSAQYSSFQIGKMLNVSRQAVNQWIDKGYIESYRTPGGHRRVRRDDLLRFLQTRSIPTPSELGAEPAGNIESTSAKPGQSSSNGPTIVVIDDDSDFAKMLVKSLNREFPNIHFEVFDNGFDALLAIGTIEPEMILLDLKISGMNGLELCRRLRDNDATSETAIIILSSVESSESRDTLAQIGITRLWSKNDPFDTLADGIIKSIRAKIAA